MIEDSTYHLYQVKNWSGLIAFGNKALEKGFDYYYLRLRMGIAYYEQKNYREAQKQFWKAYSFNSSEDVLMEYLYYCYISNTQYDEARKLSKKFSETLTKKMKTGHLPFIESVFIEAGLKRISDLAISSDAAYGLFGIVNRVGRDLSLFHAVTIFDQRQKPQNFNQKEYYVSANIPVSKNWLVSPAFHFINRTISFLPPPHQNGNGNGNGNNPPPSLVPPPITSSYYLTSLSIMRSISKFGFGVEGSWSNIDSITQTQAAISLNFFPLGNNKLSFTCLGYMQKESISKEYKYAFSPSVSATPFSKLILSASYLYNQAHHLSEMNGYVVNNSLDLTSSRIAFMGTIILSRKVNFYMLYQSENKTQNHPKNNSTTNYSYNNIIGGFKFIL